MPYGRDGEPFWGQVSNFPNQSFGNFISCSKEIIFSNKDKNKVTDKLCIILLTFLIFFFYNFSF